MSSKIIKVNNLSYKNILHQINFCWQQGEILALMGENGSGKSTLARVLTGLIEASAGDIELYLNENLCSWETYPRWREIGFVGQNPRRQTIGASVSEEIAFGLLNTGMDARAVKARVNELLKSIGMEGKENQSPATLSGGERQRLVTAAVLGLQPSFLVLDEALTMLDQRSQSSIFALLLEARKETGQLWITHDPELAIHADRLLLMKEGQLFEEKPEALFRSEFRKQYGIRLFRDPLAIQPVQKSLITEGPVLEWKSTNFNSRLVLDTKVPKGEFIGILGPSGAGKSTLLESVIGLNRPSEGSFYAYGEELKKNNIQFHRQKSRLVLQEPGEYFIGKSVYDEVFYGESKKICQEQKEERFRFLEEFGISRTMADKFPETLSGGEKQRTALAAALHTSPEVLLLDEPMLGLDGPGREHLQNKLLDLKGKITVLMVTHDLGEILEFADRLWLIEKGKLVLDCPAEEWQKHREILQQAGIRYPGLDPFSIINELKQDKINQTFGQRKKVAHENRGAI